MPSSITMLVSYTYTPSLFKLSYACVVSYNYITVYRTLVLKTISVMAFRNDSMMPEDIAFALSRSMQGALSNLHDKQIGRQ